MDLSWVFYLALCTCAIFAFGIGANDVANRLATYVYKLAVARWSDDNPVEAGCCSVTSRWHAALALP